jgi:hypothetical protein
VFGGFPVKFLNSPTPLFPRILMSRTRPQTPAVWLSPCPSESQMHLCTIPKSQSLSIIPLYDSRMVLYANYQDVEIGRPSLWATLT